MYTIKTGTFMTKCLNLSKQNETTRECYIPKSVAASRPATNRQTLPYNL